MSDDITELVKRVRSMADACTPTSPMDVTLRASADAIERLQTERDRLRSHLHGLVSVYHEFEGDPSSLPDVLGERMGYAYDYLRALAGDDHD